MPPRPLALLLGVLHATSPGAALNVYIDGVPSLAPWDGAITEDGLPLIAHKIDPELEASLPPLPPLPPALATSTWDLNPVSGPLVGKKFENHAPRVSDLPTFEPLAASIVPEAPEDGPTTLEPRDIPQVEKFVAAEQGTEAPEESPTTLEPAHLPQSRNIVAAEQSAEDGPATPEPEEVRGDDWKTVAEASAGFVQRLKQDALNLIAEGKDLKEKNTRLADDLRRVQRLDSDLRRVMQSVDTVEKRERQSSMTSQLTNFRVQLQTCIHDQTMYGERNKFLHNTAALLVKDIAELQQVPKVIS